MEISEAPEQPAAQHRILSQRYELLELIGTGGMGRVYKAHDMRLRRIVALKLLIGGGPQADQRLLLEAQSQARVEHENVCRVYEVGWGEEGEPYIVMELIDGEALSDAAAKLSFEQRAQVMIQVCEAVHAANRLGVIHRDLKPGNVLIGRTPDGGYRACVTDFGLARDVADGKLTGSVVGTPNYMAPEQARGDTARIDRRTDVYGLGASFYEVLTGQFPFDGTPYDILQKVLDSDPIPPTKVDPAIPRDLAAITRKCMEKDQRQRYDSARAVGEDLHRWLDGEPILARAPRWDYRARRYLHKHRYAALTALSVAILAAVGITIGWTSRSKARRLAEQFGQDVKEIEGRMRFALVLPLHEISKDEAAVREQMARIEKAMKPLGKEGQGPGEYALGRGYLALGEFAEARKHFQRAWDSNYRPPELGTGLGLALVALYREGLHDISRSRDPMRRERLRAELQKEFRAPARIALQLGEGATTEPARYVEALMRYCDDDFDGAEKAAKEALLQAPWLYEARILLGQVHRDRGARRRQAGDEQGAHKEFEQARDELETSTDFGRSDPRAWRELCALWTDEIALQLSRGAPFDELPEQMLTACESAVKASPKRPEGYTQLAAAERTWAEVLLRDGRDAALPLAKAEQAARTALKESPGDLDALGELGGVLRLSALLQLSRGDDGSGRLEEALSALRTVAKGHPERLAPQLSLAQALADAAALQLERETGQEGPLLYEAESLCTAAKALDEEALAPQVMRRRLELLRAKSARLAGKDPRPLVEDAVANLGPLAQASQSPADWLLLAQGQALLAGLEVAQRRDPLPLAQAALGSLEKAASERAGPDGRRAQAAVHLALAQAALSKGEDPLTECELGRVALGGPQAPGAGRASAALLAVELAEVEALGSPARKEPVRTDARAQAEAWAQRVLSSGTKAPALARALDRLRSEAKRRE
jgi:eukaryotic-like serine/threonine-protein kinase